MKRILIWGYNPNSDGGLSKITRLINHILKKNEYAVRILAYDGQASGFEKGIQNVTFFIEKDWNFIINEMIKQKPDLIISIGDLWRCEFIADLVK